MGTLWLKAVSGHYATLAQMAASDATLSAVISDRGIVSGARRNVANPMLRAPTRAARMPIILLIRIRSGIIQQ